MGLFQKRENKLFSRLSAVGLSAAVGKSLFCFIYRVFNKPEQFKDYFFL